MAIYRNSTQVVAVRNGTAAIARVYHGTGLVFDSAAAVLTAVALSAADKSALLALSGGNLSATHGATSGWAGVRANSPRAAGRYYFEYTVTGLGTDGNHLVGLGALSSSLSNYAGIDAGSIGFRVSSGVFFHTNTPRNATGLGGQVGDTFCFDVDLSLDTIKVQRIRSGAASGWSAAQALPAGLIGKVAAFPFLTCFDSGAGGTFGFKPANWVGTPPAGAGAWPEVNPQARRFYRLNITAANGATQIAFTEMEMQIAGVDQTSVNEYVVVSSNLNSFGWTNPLALFDNSTALSGAYGNGWATPSNVTAGWLVYDFGDDITKAIDALKIYARSDQASQTSMPKDFTLSASPNGQDYTVLKTVTGAAWVQNGSNTWTIP